MLYIAGLAWREVGTVKQPTSRRNKRKTRDETAYLYADVIIGINLRSLATTGVPLI